MKYQHHNECSPESSPVQVPNRPGSRAFFDHALLYSSKLYRDGIRGMLLIQLQAENGNSVAGSPVALVTEHRPFESRQYNLRFEGNKLATRLPVGEYSVVVSAQGYEPFRALVSIYADQEARLDAKLTDLRSKGPTFEQILAKNLIRRDARSLRNLTVEEGTTLTLDQASGDLGADREHIELQTLADVKRVMGCPDTAFVGEYPRFGRFSPDRASANLAVPEALNFAQRAALQEYVYGNSISVATWGKALDKWILSEAISIGLWVWQDIDVGRNAVLEVTSNGLVCNTLRVHYTGRVIFKGPGPTKIEMNHFVKYGLFEDEVVHLDDPLSIAHG